MTGVMWLLGYISVGCLVAMAGAHIKSWKPYGNDVVMASIAFSVWPLVVPVWALLEVARALINGAILLNQKMEWWTYWKKEHTSR